MATSTSGPPAESLDDLNGQRGPVSAATMPAVESETASVNAPSAGAALPRPAPEHPRPHPHPVHTPVQRPSTPPTGLDSPIESAPKRSSKAKRLLILIPILLIVVAVAGWMGYRYWYDSTYFLSTDNASVTGDLVQVGSLNAGRIVATRVDVGRPVQQGQEIAVVAMPQEVGSTAQGVGPKMGVTGNADTLVSVYAPMSGIVAARMGYVGGTVAAGQPIYSLIDPSQVWIKANIEESSAWRVQTGQLVEIHVDALNRDFMGHIEAITPASAATFSLLPSNNASGNFTKVTQYVPIKIVVDDARGVVLPLGTSVEIRIHVAQPSSDFPLPWRP